MFRIDMPESGAGVVSQVNDLTINTIAKTGPTGLFLLGQRLYNHTQLIQRFLIRGAYIF